MVKVELTTQLTALRCPTKSLSHFQPLRSMIWAVGPPIDESNVIKIKITQSVPSFFRFIL